ncbi:MAG: GGDEF domain-containing protein [Planctomycetes bacterium]|nr:GGDEF domain-containing protein [Planctomycetota bacterium]
MTLFAVITETVQGLLTDTMALAAVALLGYLFGHRTRQSPADPINEKLAFELSRAASIAKELQQVAQRIRQDVSSHQSKIAKFKSRIGNLQRDKTADGWQTLNDEAEALLVPTMKLATNLSLAYDQLRKQSTQLMNFADTRTDPQTGVRNRRAMEEQLDVLFSLHAQNNSRFSLALFSMGPQSEGNSPSDHSDDQLRRFAGLLENCSRDTDLVARSSTEEFVVLMPHTSLAGATIYSERLLQQIADELGCVTGGGIVEVQADDTPQKILTRADSALYSARTNNYSCLYLHNGKTLRPHDGVYSAGPKESQEVVSSDDPSAEPALAAH